MMYGGEPPRAAEEEDKDLDKQKKGAKNRRCREHCSLILQQKLQPEKCPFVAFNLYNTTFFIKGLGIILILICFGCFYVDDSRSVGKTYNTSAGNGTLVEFTVPADFRGPIYFYYELDNFYGNTRLYVQSKPPYLFGPQSTCSPIRTLKEALEVRVPNTRSALDELTVLQTDGVPETARITPCGMASICLFTDEFQLLKQGADGTLEEIVLTKEGIALDVDDEVIRVAQPTEGDVKWYDVARENYLVWMRDSATPSFLRLYGFNNDALEEGTYFVNVTKNEYPIDKEWYGTKGFRILSLSPLGGPVLVTIFLGFAWGGFMVVVAVMMIVLQLMGCRWTSTSFKRHPTFPDLPAYEFVPENRLPPVKSSMDIAGMDQAAAPRLTENGGRQGTVDFGGGDGGDNGVDGAAAVFGGGNTPLDTGVEGGVPELRVSAEGRGGRGKEDGRPDGPSSSAAAAANGFPSPSEAAPSRLGEKSAPAKKTLGVSEGSLGPSPVRSLQADHPASSPSIHAQTPAGPFSGPSQEKIPAIADAATLLQDMGADPESASASRRRPVPQTLGGDTGPIVQDMGVDSEEEERVLRQVASAVADQELSAQRQAGRRVLIRPGGAEGSHGASIPPSDTGNPLGFSSVSASPSDGNTAVRVPLQGPLLNSHRPPSKGREDEPAAPVSVDRPRQPSPGASSPSHRGRIGSESDRDRDKDKERVGNGKPILSLCSQTAHPPATVTVPPLPLINFERRPRKPSEDNPVTASVAGERESQAALQRDDSRASGCEAGLDLLAEDPILHGEGGGAVSGNVHSGNSPSFEFNDSSHCLCDSLDFSVDGRLRPSVGRLRSESECRRSQMEEGRL